MIPLKVGLAEAIVIQQSLKVVYPSTTVMQHGSMSVEYFAPKIKDIQIPHEQDELYVITSGKATFIRGDEMVPCTTGDVLFVPAGVKHRFENFSDNFGTWVIFYGPEGGEAI